MLRKPILMPQKQVILRRTDFNHVVLYKYLRYWNILAGCRTFPAQALI